MKHFLTILLISCAHYAFAEKLIFQNNNEQVEITGDAFIDNQTGDITVVTVGEHEIISAGSQPVILGFYPSDYDIAVGGSISVSWSVAFASSCTASVISGAASWTGSKQSANGEYTETGINVTQLPATLNLTCQNSGNLQTVKSIQLTEEVNNGGGGTNPAFTLFRVNNQSPAVTITPPGTATVTWSTTDINACTASASPSVSGWSGAKATNGTQTLTITQSTTVSMTCDGITRNVSVTYDDNTNPNCSSNVYPQGLSLGQATYIEINDNQQFGESTNTSFLLNMNTSQFFALSGFQYDAIDSRRRIVIADAPTNFRLMGQGTMSISECPGDFTNTAKCVIPISRSGANRTVRISTRLTDIGDPLYCVVDPNETYFVNFVHSPDPGVVQPECDSAQNQTCAVFYSEALLN